MTADQAENSLRPMHCELNLLTRSDGSAMLTQGSTAVVVSVNGPIEVKLQHMNVEKSYIDIYFKPRSGLGSVNDRLLESLIKSTYESAILTGLHPRTCISIQIQEMQDQGGLVACAINAVCLALMNSGIEMKYLVAAVHCILRKDGEIVLDPDELQSKDSLAKFTFVFENCTRNTVSIYTHGKFTTEQYHRTLKMAEEAVEKVFEFYGNIVGKQREIL